VSGPDVTNSPEPHSAPLPSVLVVDDEPSLAQTLGFLLRDDHEVVLATSGRQAIEVLRGRHDFDVILCDLMMPSVSGIDVHDWLATNYPGTERCMVFMTGGTFTPKAVQFVSAVPNYTIDKPFSIEAIQGIIREVAAASAARRG
jgi:two-component system, cell cycle sensor histidine kinase and response regulator CckA